MDDSIRVVALREDLAELLEVAKLTPDQHRKVHGRCPPGFNWDGKHCVPKSQTSAPSQSDAGDPEHPGTASDEPKTKPTTRAAETPPKYSDWEDPIGADEDGFVENDHDLRPTRGEWTDSLEHLPLDTKEEHYERGELKSYRKRLHDKIVEHFVSRYPRVPDDQKPVVVMTMGLPASGKSTLTRPERQSGDFALSDPDEVKSKLPEYREAIHHRARNAAQMVQEESRDLGGRIVDAAIEGRRNFVMDGTGRDPDYCKRTLARLKEKGYHIKLKMTDTSNTDIAYRRVQQRGEETGRLVSKQFIDETAPVLPKNFFSYIEDVDDFELYDTNDLPPRKVWSLEAGQEEEHDPDYVAAFRKRAGRAEPSAPGESVDAFLQDLRQAMNEQNRPDEQPEPDEKPLNVDPGQYNDEAMQALTAELERLDAVDISEFDPANGAVDDPEDSWMLGQAHVREQWKKQKAKAAEPEAGESEPGS